MLPLYLPQTAPGGVIKLIAFCRISDQWPLQTRGSVALRFLVGPRDPSVLDSDQNAAVDSWAPQLWDATKEL